MLLLKYAMEMPVLLFRPINPPETFQCPLVPILPLASLTINIILLTQLPLDAVYKLLVWTALGLLVYFAYGIRHSKIPLRPEGTASISHLRLGLTDDTVVFYAPDGSEGSTEFFGP